MSSGGLCRGRQLPLRDVVAFAFQLSEVDLYAWSMQGLCPIGKLKRSHVEFHVIIRRLNINLPDRWHLDADIG
jgi:hypothetical protein